MPPRNDINKLNHIKDQFGYTIYIFTWRDWGEVITNGKKIKYFDIKNITEEWLSNNNIIINKIFYEKGNLHNPATQDETMYENRIYLSKKYKIKYFVEDDLQKAIVLANICKAVFLIDHIYNQNIDLPFHQLPHNVIRVNGWEEIYEYLKHLG